MIMSEKHTFLVSILDGMDKKVADIGEKLLALESRVQTLEKNQNRHLLNAQQIFQASNCRQNDLEKKLRDCASAISIYAQKCEVIDQLSARVAQIETREHPNQSNDIEHVSLAIYGLYNSDDITRTVNKLFSDMNLGHVRCVTATRTPHRPESYRQGVVIVNLRCLKDKQDVLSRKHLLRTHPVYRSVFIKTAKSHTEQIMDANFNVVLNEMNNGRSYYISDNGRIRQKASDNRDGGRTGVSSTYMYNSSSNAYGGARPNTHSHSNRDYMYNNRVNGYQQYTDRENVRYNGQDYRYHTQHGNNSHDSREYVRQDHTSNTWRNSCGRRTSDTPKMYTEPRDENKTYDSYTTQYMDKYAQHMDLKN